MKFVLEYLQIGFGIVLASIGLKAFLLPNGFLDGGVTGIAILISEQTGWNISILLVLISIPFLIMAAFTVSRTIVIKSAISIVSLALSIQLETFETITEDKLLIAIFGGVFLGGGIGIAIRNGSVLDGSEILGIFLNDRLGISIGSVILLFNTILFSITAFVISVEIAMYSILTYLVTAKVIDFIIEGFEDFIGVMIISKEPEAIENAILSQIRVGLTSYKGDTGFGNSGKKEDFKIIFTVINRIDIRKIQRLVDNIDKNAFIVELDVNNIKGGAHRRYFRQNSPPPLPPEVYQSAPAV